MRAGWVAFIVIAVAVVTVGVINVIRICNEEWPLNPKSSRHKSGTHEGEK